MAARGWLAGTGVLVHLALLCVPLALCGLLESAIDDGTAVLFAALGAAWVAGEILSQAPGMGASPPGYGVDRALAAVTGVSVLAVFVVGLLERAGAPAPVPRWEVWMGAASMALGTAVRCAAIRRLGIFFVTEARVAPGQALVVTGVYRLLRHPSEAGLQVIAMGAAALLGSRMALAAWALTLLPTSIARVRREDAVLSRAFPAAHARYASRVGALLPRISLS